MTVLSRLLQIHSFSRYRAQWTEATSRHDCPLSQILRSFMHNKVWIEMNNGERNVTVLKLLSRGVG